MFDHIKQQFGKFGTQPKIRKIAAIGLSQEEVTLLASMLTIITIRKEENWQITDTHEAEIFLVNINSCAGEVFLCRYGKTLPIIRYSQDKEQKMSGQLNKPLRARELLQALAPFEKPMAAGIIAQNNAGWSDLKQA